MGSTGNEPRGTRPEIDEPLSGCRVAIVGLGLMGASLAAALQGAVGEVMGISRRRATVEDAKQRGWIDRGDTDGSDLLAAADVVVLATPVRTILRLLGEIGPSLRQGCLVMDLGSTKRVVLDAMEQLPDGVQPLGGHPMCGKETAGIAAADPALYRGCTFILCPLERTSPEASALGERLVEAVGARPLRIDAERHDRLVASISHLPYLMASALVRTADELTSDDPAAWEIAAGGFRDGTRVAESDVAMMLDILTTNGDRIRESARVFRDLLDDLLDRLRDGDERSLRDLLAANRTKRQRMVTSTVRSSSARAKKEHR